jgi:hypothetical protein
VTSVELIAIMEAAARTGTKCLVCGDLHLEMFGSYEAQAPVEKPSEPEPDPEEEKKDAKAEAMLDQMRRILNGTDEDLLNGLFPLGKEAEE